MTDDLNARLREAVRRRNNLATNVNRIEARVEAAKQNLAAAEAECRSKGIDPEQIDSYVQQLEQRFNDAVLALEQDVSAAEAAIEPFLKEISQ